MNEMQVTLRGNVASDPRFHEFGDGGMVTSFRLASTSRFFDRERSAWVDRETTYVSVNCRRWMAQNAIRSLAKGQPLVVTGRMRERYWESEGRAGRTLEIEADAVGHDLTYGETRFTRVSRTQETRSQDQAGDDLAAKVVDDSPPDDRTKQLIDLSAMSEALPELPDDPSENPEFELVTASA